jgi:hypothetical protein
MTVSPGIVMKSTVIEYWRDAEVELRTLPLSFQPVEALPVQTPAATSGRAFWAALYLGTATVVDDPPADGVVVGGVALGPEEQPKRVRAATAGRKSASSRRSDVRPRPDR